MTVQDFTLAECLHGSALAVQFLGVLAKLVLELACRLLVGVKTLSEVELSLSVLGDLSLEF